MKKYRMSSVFAILAVALTIIMVPVTAMAAINASRITKTASFHYTLDMEQTKNTDAFNFGAPSGTTGSASTKFTWTTVKHTLQSGYYTEVKLQSKVILGMWNNIGGSSKLDNFKTSSTAYLNFTNVPFDKDLRFRLYNYSVYSVGDGVMTVTY